MTLCRPPKAVLRPFVSLIWASDSTEKTPSGTGRELILPTGAMHIVLRQGDRPLRLFAGPDDRSGYVVGTSVIGGVRDTAFCKDISEPVPTVGVMLRSGVADLLSRTPAGTLAGQHTCLDDIWGQSYLVELRERLNAAPSSKHRLLILEDVLARCLPAVRGIDPLIAHALFRLDRGVAVGDVVAESGFSHRHLVRAFAETVGHSPKTYSRLRRFNRVLDRLNSVPNATLADAAAAEGYADQAHMTREFQAIAGVTPGDYRRIAPVSARHIPIST